VHRIEDDGLAFTTAYMLRDDLASARSSRTEMPQWSCLGDEIRVELREVVQMFFDY
jgi:hypothetical protein